MKFKKAIWNVHNRIDRALKFPYLGKGQTGVQVGFDMCHPVTSDLFKMARCVGPEGLVIGIDPDPENHTGAIGLIEKYGFRQIRLLQNATHGEAGVMELKLGMNATWNQLSALPLDDTAPFREESIQVKAEPLDQLVQSQQTDLAQIRHINITNNGAEFVTLQGATRLLSDCPALSVTLTTGRQDPSGMVGSRPDHEVCLELLRDFGFECRFYRLKQLFWWAFCTKLLLNRQWVYGRQNYGVILAAKNLSIPWHQSFC